MRLSCISLHQPWASVIFCVDQNSVPVKRDETRHWQTNVRGRIAIHAAKTTKALSDFDDEDLPFELRDTALPLGCILGTVELVDCHRTKDIRSKRTKEQLAWGDYSDGRFAFELAWPVLFDTPIPYRGMQSWFEVEIP